MIAFNNVGICFDGRWVLKKFCGSIGKGVTLLSGPSGSGKSTLISILLGLTTSTEGDVSYPEGTVFAYCGSRPSMFYEKSFAYNLQRILGVDRPPERLVNLIEGMKATPLLKRIPNRLSGGERRKLEIILCLSKEADVYILDEPLSGLDRESKQAVIDYLEAHRHEAVFLVVNHDPAVKVEADQIIRLSETSYSIHGETGGFCPKGHSQKNRFGVLACFGHLFRVNKALSLLEWGLFLAFGLTSVGSIALSPPSDSSIAEKIVASDPSAAFLFSGDPDGLTFDSFVDKTESDHLFVLPLVQSNLNNYQSTGGFLLPYDGDEFLVLQNCTDSQGYNLQEDYSYVAEGATVEGCFTFIDESNENLDFLNDYSLFSDVLSGAPGAILLCPQSQFADVVISMANGEFSSDNYLEINGGVVSLPSPRLASLGFTSGLSSLVFEPGYRTIPVVEGDSFWLSLPSNIEPNIFGSTTTVPFMNGQPAVSLPAYLYLCMFGADMNQRESNSDLLYLGLNREAALSTDLGGLNPEFTIAYSPNTLRTARLSLQYCSIGFGVIFAAVFVISFLRVGRFESRTTEVLRLNGTEEKKARLFVGFSYILLPTAIILFSFLVYLAGFLPAFNLLQASLDYPNGYGEAASYLASIGPIGFYSFSAWPLFLLLCPFIYLTHLLPRGEKRR